MNRETSHILISVRPQFSKLIENGVKTVELRKRIPDNLQGRRVYIYATLPEAKIIGYFEVNNVEFLPISDLWKKVEPIAGIGRKDFFSYYTGKTAGYGIFFKKFVKREKPLTLETIRRTNPDFVPPQSYYYMSSCFYENIK